MLSATVDIYYSVAQQCQQYTLITVIVMGCCCAKENWDHLRIESSYSVEKDNILSLPCCNPKKQYVHRDPETGRNTKNVNLLFDDVDTVLSVSFI